MTRALIFDFDGVVAGSEMLVNGAMADALTGLGLRRNPHVMARRSAGHPGDSNG